jgi:PAS domain S-box-containing protein
MNGAARGRRRTIRVLHAEDDDSFRDLVSEILGAEDDIAVVSEPTPEQAFERLDTEQFDCVISDYDGDEEAAFLRLIEATVDGTPCILLTGKERETVDPAATPGIDEYIQKGRGSGQFDLLADRVRNHAERYRAAERHRALFEEGAPPMTVHDAETGRVVEANPQYAELLGYSRNEASSLEMAEIFPNEEPYTAERAMEYLDAAASGDTQTFEWMDVTASGEWVPV